VRSWIVQTGRSSADCPHWGCNARRFLPHDFELRTRVTERYGKNFFPEDCTSQDWGVTFEDVEPYYDQFEHIYGVGGKAGNLDGEIQPGGNPHEGPRSREYPNRRRRTPRAEVRRPRPGGLPLSGPAAAMTQVTPICTR
jgi:gluconate 2-dehydrogenase alpha chain